MISNGNALSTTSNNILYIWRIYVDFGESERGREIFNWLINPQAAKC